MSPALKNTLIGCGLALGLFVLVGVGSCVGFVIWLNRPGTLIEPEKLIGDDTTGYISWTLRNEDPGTRRMVGRLLETFQGEQRREHPFPDWMGQWLQEYQNGRNRQQLEQLFPVVVVYTIRPGEAPEDDLALFTLSLKGMGNRMVLMDWVLGLAFGMSGEVEVDSHRDEKIITFRGPRDSGFTFFIRGNDLFLTSDVETARRAVDGLLARAAAPEGATGQPSGIEQYLQRAPADRPLRGAVTNRRGELVRMLGSLPASEADAERAAALSGLGGIAISGGFEDERIFKGRIDCLGPDAAWSSANAGTLAEEFRYQIARLHLDAETAFAVDGPWVTIDYTIQDPAEQLGTLIDLDRLERKARERVREEEERTKEERTK